MTDATDILKDGYGRIADLVSELVKGASPQALAWRPAVGANTAGWMLWHLSRVQDDHLAGAFGTEQVWVRDGWVERFGLPFDAAETGYGMSADEVGRVRVTGDLLGGYHEAVHAQTLALLSGDLELDKVVDDSFVPPVTLAARLISVIEDDLRHAGQAAYLLGLAR